jgi:hypothetical protein
MKRGILSPKSDYVFKLLSGDERHRRASKFPVL